MDTSISSYLRSLVISKDDGKEVAPHLTECYTSSATNNCGIFAIAFTLHKLLGDNLEDIEFDQCQMSDHLLECLKKRKFSYFPTKLKCGYRSMHFPYREIELFCTCLMPEMYGEMMIECERCELWFHTYCVGLSSAPDSTEHLISRNANSS